MVHSVQAARANMQVPHDCACFWAFLGLLDGHDSLRVSNLQGERVGGTELID